MKKQKYNCRFCKSLLTHTFVDLGLSPVANDYIRPEHKQKIEPTYPLHVFVCSKCFLVQLPDTRREDEIFRDDYAYFSSFSSSWLAHSKAYTEKMITEFGISDSHLVVELASNDGYLLQYFKNVGVPVLGIEPCASVALAAENKGIPTIRKFFGVDTAKELVNAGKKADLIVANNVLAHVPDLNDFVKGIKILLKKDGFATLEFPHLMQLMNYTQFDTIYHEHFSYFSFTVVKKIFASFGLSIFDVEELSTHGGSLRIYAQLTEGGKRKENGRVSKLLQKEKKASLLSLSTYKKFTKRVEKVKTEMIAFIKKAKKQDKMIVGYGAPAKGNTFLNYCGIGAEMIRYTVDKNPHKQNHFLPGSRIPVFSPDKIVATKPDYLFILPWNLKDEIMQEMKNIKSWKGKFVVGIPKLQILT